MAKRDPIEQALNRISALKAADVDAAFVDELRTLLNDRSNLVAAKAAKLAGARRVAALTPELVAAFHKLIADAPRVDKHCAVLTEIVAALYEMDYAEPEVFRRGLSHVQMEPSYGGAVDAAAQLRGLCAMGLVRTRDREALADVVALLVDPEPPARIGAVRALATNGGEAGALALRLKVLTGESEPEVLAECFFGLLAAQSASSVAFVARYVDAEEAAIAEAAILALGASRGPHAIPVLKEKWERTGPGPMKKVLLFALATSRNEEALQFLLALLGSAPIGTAIEVLSALCEQRPSESIRAAIQSAVEHRAHESLIIAYKSLYPA